jgi:Bacterial Ig-like domain
MNLSIAAKLGLPALALVGVLAACTPPEPVVDKTTFTVSPTDKATGVAETSKVVLTYTAAMADAAKTSVTLKDGAAVLPSTPVWDAAKKVLTVTPTSTLGFSKSISVVVAAAKDAAGGDVDPRTTSFTVKTAPVGGTDTPATLDGANTDGFFKADSAATPSSGGVAGMRVGYTVDSATGAPDGDGKAFISFTLPAGVSAAKVNSAKLTLVNTPRSLYDAANGELTKGDGTDLFAANKSLLLESLVFGGGALSAGDFATTGTVPVTIASNAALANIDVTAAIKADLTAARTKSQFRVALSTPTPRPAAGYWIRIGGDLAPAANRPTLVLNVAP